MLWRLLGFSAPFVQSKHAKFRRPYWVLCLSCI